MAAPDLSASLIDWRVMISDLKFLVEENLNGGSLPSLEECLTTAKCQRRLLPEIKVVESNIRKEERLSSLEARAYALGYAHALTCSLNQRSYYQTLYSLGKRKREVWQAAQPELPIVCHPLPPASGVIIVEHPEGLYSLTDQEWCLVPLEDICHNFTGNRKLCNRPPFEHDLEALNLESVPRDIPLKRVLDASFYDPRY